MREREREGGGGGGVRMYGRDCGGHVKGASAMGSHHFVAHH